MYSVPASQTDPASEDVAAEDGIPRHPPPPLLTWEDEERRAPGQPDLPGFVDKPISAERACLQLARQWHAEASAVPDGAPLPRSLDTYAHACLLLSVEWGRDFTVVVRSQFKHNRDLAAARRDGTDWYDVLPWTLSLAADSPDPSRTDAVRTLTANLNHHKSSIRSLMLDLAWFVASWLRADDAAPRLLDNLTNTLLAPSESAGLAARLFPDPDSFFAFAEVYSPPAPFERQYKDRLAHLRTAGILSAQAPFWKLEAACRHLTSRESFASRLQPPPLLPASTSADHVNPAPSEAACSADSPTPASASPTPNMSDVVWIRQMQTLFPDATFCLEARKAPADNSASAVVKTDQRTRTTTIFLNVTLKWMDGLKVSRIMPEMQVTEERLEIPQVVYRDGDLHQFNTSTSVRLLLVFPDKTATYIRIPWRPEDMPILDSTERWIFWSFPDQQADLDSFYYGFGDFGTSEAFYDYINNLFPET